jgi:hypothetical protein
MTEPYREDSQDSETDRMVDTPASLRDDDPEAPRGDRGSGAEDRPLGAEKFGTTHAEAEQGESLDQRLAEEVPDDTGDPVDDVVAENPQLFGEDPAQTDDQVLDDAYGDPDAHDLDVAGDGVGQVVAPDEGAHADLEKDVVGTDAGRPGDDESDEVAAEEAALHAEEER